MNNNYYIVNLTHRGMKNKIHNFNYNKIDYKEVEDIRWIEFDDISNYETNRQLKEIYKHKNYIIKQQ